MLCITTNFPGNNLHPAGTSDRSDICEGFPSFGSKFYNKHRRVNIFGNLHKQPIRLTQN